jgi:mono/diheme cytochrome c family protein
MAGTRMLLVVAPAMVAAALSVSQSLALTELEQRGRTLAAGFCSGCHAIGKTGASPRAGAPPFRELDRQLDLDKFTDRLREGLLGSHRDMPMFRFDHRDANALVAYLRTIQGP